MRITKSARMEAAGTPTAEQLVLLNRYTRTALKAEQVYVFSVRLCDDRVDRDFECFTPEALQKMATLFLGKTGIADHDWSAEKQVARIFDTRMVTGADECYLEAWAYMLRSEKNAALIAEIEAGIHKEVSIGCSVGRATCSICGAEYGTCGHRKGESYAGQRCVKLLSEPTDCYEFSFVAVPAQREAGVTKAWKGGLDMRLSELVEKSGSQSAAAELREMERLAALGRQYRAAMEQELVRLGLAIDFGASEKTLKGLAESLDDDALCSLRGELKQRAERLYPPKTQLQQISCAAGIETDFLI